MIRQTCVAGLMALSSVFMPLLAAAGDKSAPILKIPSTSWESSPIGEALAWQAYHSMSSSQYQQQFNTLVSGYNLVHVSGYSVGGMGRFAAIWNDGPSAAWVARHDQTSAGYQTNGASLRNEQL
jgi:hypothetical protein